MGVFIFIPVMAGGFILSMLLNPVVMQALRNAWYIDKLKKQMREEAGMPEIPDPEEDTDARNIKRN